MTDAKQPSNQADFTDFLVLGHLVKYNLYLWAKAQIFSSLVQNMPVDAAIEETNRVIGELDLDTKSRRAAEQAAGSNEGEELIAAS